MHRLSFLIISAFPLLTVSVFAQGSLTPPGPPAPTMLTLDQLGTKADQANTKLDQALAKLDKRTPISALPFTISSSGSYYLAGNLQFTATSGDAITISASDVTLDLMGFTLSSAAGVVGNAITIASAGRVTVANGNIAGNTTVSVTGSPPNQSWTVTPSGFGNGIVATGASLFQFHNLHISGCRSFGLETTLGLAIVRDVTVTQNGSFGIITGNSAMAGTVSNSVAFQNGAVGITNRGGVISSCTAMQNATIGIACTFGSILNSTSSYNGGDGLSSNNGVISNCQATSNNGHGIAASGSSVMNSTAYGNGNHGITVATGGVVAFCSATVNNSKNNGSADINAPAATRTGNNPAP